MIFKNGKRIDSCSDTVPIGTLNPYIGSTAPFGYLLCEGQLVSKSTYKELWEICGNTFGQSTETQFYLPDLRGRVIAGYKEGDSVFGTLGGLIGSKNISYTPAGSNSGGAVQNHTLTAAESGLPSHNHTITHQGWYNSPPNTTGSERIVMSFRTISGDDTTSDFGCSSPSKNATSGHNHPFTNPTFTGTAATLDIVQPTMNLNYIVKAIMMIPNQSTVVNNEETSEINVYSCDYINELKQQMFDFAHPVGSYYETSDAGWTPTAAGWYGTWVIDNDGTTLVSYKSNGAFNKAVGTTVGEESHTLTVDEMPYHNHQYYKANSSTQAHVLTIDEMPSHNHVFKRGTTGDSWWGISSRESQDPPYTGTTESTGGNQGHSHEIWASLDGTSNVGGNGAHNNIQPSKVVYRWHRTA